MPESTDDNKKESGKMVVALGSQLISTAMTMIALTGAMLTYILTNKDPSTWTYVFFGLAMVMFVISIFMGGTGIDTVKSNALIGTWDTKTNKANFFNRQVICIFVGIIFCLLLPFTGNKVVKPEPGIVILDQLLQKQTSTDSTLNVKDKELKLLRSELNLLKQSKDTLRKR
jgi:hypothetical protein